MTIINKIDPRSVAYEQRFLETPKHSTVALDRFLTKHDCLRPGTEVLDLGTAAGTNVAYLGSMHPETKFLGTDYNAALIEVGGRMLSEKGIKNAALEAADWFDLPAGYRERFDGVFNVHTLCCFKHLEPALDAIIKLRPRWFAFNSLFYEGPLDVLIHIRSHVPPLVADDDPDGDFNTFSLPQMQRYVAERGYTDFFFERFAIPVDLPRPKNGERGTFTARTEMEERSQFSGPVYLPWYFVLARQPDTHYGKR